MRIVQKYGGTSVGSIERMRAVAKRLLETQAAGHEVIAVVSAMSGETNRLTALATDASSAPSPREMDVLLATGEQASVALLAMTINAMGGSARSFLGYQIKMLTDGDHQRARVQEIDKSAIDAALSEGIIPIIAGFQGVDKFGNITTLGRGGSDTSAVAIAAGIGADLCEILTDVDGVYTTDPRICDCAKKIDVISFDEMMELASLGAKVLQIRSVEIAKAHAVPLTVRNSFNHETGTRVLPADQVKSVQPVVGVSLEASQAIISVCGRSTKDERFDVVSLSNKASTEVASFDLPQLATALLVLSGAGIMIDVVAQSTPPPGINFSRNGSSSSVGSLGSMVSYSFSVASADCDRACKLLRTALSNDNENQCNIKCATEVSKVSIVGRGMQHVPGIMHQMLKALREHDIDILAITSSDIKISCLVPVAVGELAVNALHSIFVD